MKTNILTLAIIALMMGISLNAIADKGDTSKVADPAVKTEFQASVHLYPDNIVKFLVKNADNDKVKLQICDEQGIALYTYILKNEHVARIGFDIHELDPGKYDYVIEKNKEEVLRKTIEKVVE